MIQLAITVVVSTLVVGALGALALRRLPTVRLQLAAFGLLAVALPLAAVLASGWVMFHMHADVKIGDARVLASDGGCEGKPEFKGFALTISAKTAAEADNMFAALSDGGKVQMPMSKTFFSERFGMLADKFGVGWMVIVEK